MKVFATRTLTALALGIACFAIGCGPELIVQPRSSKVRRDLKTFDWAIAEYRTAHKALPKSLVDLTRAESGSAALIDADPEDLTDPWGEAYAYVRVRDTGYRVTCYGADGIPGGDGEDADITLDRSVK
jgi:general secretion pathway protein G